MDNIVFEDTINTEISSSEFVDKQWLYVNDNNNSSYSGQVVIDSTSLSNCGNYLNWQESFLAFPMVLQVESQNPGDLPANQISDFMVGLKSGYWQIIHSLIVEYNNSNVVQQVPYLNIFNSFRANTSYSLGDVENWGGLIGFCPDSADSWLYNNLAIIDYTVDPNTNILAASGTGLCNNLNAPYVNISTFVYIGTDQLAVDPASGIGPAADLPLPTNSYNRVTQATTRKSSLRSSTYNKGLWKRQQWLIYDPYLNNGLNIGNYSSNQGALMTTNTGSTLNLPAFGAIFQSYIQSGAGYRVIIFDAIIRMKDICDLFDKLPMIKGGSMRLYINTNQTYITAASVNAVVNANGEELSHSELYLNSSPVILGGGQTCPVMITSSDIGQGLSNFSSIGTAPLQQNFSVGLSIVRTQFQQLQQFSAPLTSTRLYCPAYTLSPLAEQRLLSLAPTKKIVYNDIFYYNFNTVPPGTFNFLVSNGIPNLRGCLVCPFIAKVSNGVQTPSLGNAITDTILSPFTSSPASPDPISLTNFNIQVSGKNCFISNLLYDYEVFTEQLVSSNQLNGSLTTSMASGLIGFSEFENLYRYYYANISRSIPSEDGVAKAVQVLGTNNSTVTINFIVFLEFERTITVDIRTGARLA